MENVVVDRAEFIVSKLSSTLHTERRILIAIAGVPASGKSSFAIRLVNRVNTLLEADAQTQGQHQTQAILVGLDGWHLTRAQLDAMPDPKLAHDRRGIHWTFDGTSYLEFVKCLRIPLSKAPPIISAPSFDHAIKDPTPDAVSIHPYHRIIIIEGLYTMLDYETWSEAAGLVDERWWVEIDPARAKERLVKRHVLTGVAKDMVEAIWRAENNDEDNGNFIAQKKYKLTYTIQSVDDPAYSN